MMEMQVESELRPAKLSIQDALLPCTLHVHEAVRPGRFWLVLDRGRGHSSALIDILPPASKLLTLRTALRLLHFVLSFLATASPSELQSGSGHLPDPVPECSQPRPPVA